MVSVVRHARRQPAPTLPEVVRTLAQTERAPDVLNQQREDTGLLALARLPRQSGLEHRPRIVGVELARASFRRARCRRIRSTAVTTRRAASATHGQGFADVPERAFSPLTGSVDTPLCEPGGVAGSPSWASPGAVAVVGSGGSAGAGCSSPPVRPGARLAVTATPSGPSSSSADPPGAMWHRAAHEGVRPGAVSGREDARGAFTEPISATKRHQVQTPISAGAQVGG